MSNMSGGNVIWDLDVDAKKFDAGITNAQNKAKSAADNIDDRFDKTSKNVKVSLDSVSSSLDSMGNKLTIAGGAITGILGATTLSAIKFDDSLADVRKSAGLTEKETTNLGQAILDMGKNTRTSNAELVDIAKIGGQLGITQKQMLPFIESVNQAAVALGDEFTGGAEQVTKELGILANQFKLAGKDGETMAPAITKIGSALNSLGAAGQATAPYITDFGNRVGGIAPVVGLSIDKVFGLGAALEELGQSPEVAGTAIQSLLVTMGKDLPAFADMAGVSLEEFTQLLRTDVNEALLLVAKETTNGADSIDILAARLDELGIDGQRTVGVLANLGNNTELVRKRQALAAEEFKKGTSLLTEYNIKNETAAADLGKLSNRVFDLSHSLGSALVPGLLQTVDAISPFIEKFADFAEKNPGVISGIAKLGVTLTALGISFKILAGTIGLVKGAMDGIDFVKNIGVVGKLASGISKAGTAFSGLAKGAGIAKGAMAGFIPLPILVGIGLIIALVTLLAFAWKNNWGDIQGKTKAAIDFIKTNFDNFMKTLDNIKKSVGDFVQNIKDLWDGFMFAIKWDDSALLDSALESFGIFDQGIKDFLGTLSGFIRDTKNKFDTFVNNIKNIPKSVGEFIQKIKDVFKGIKDIPKLIFEGDFTGAMGRAFGIDEDSPIITGFLNFRKTVIDVFKSVVTFITNAAKLIAAPFIWLYSNIIEPIVMLITAVLLRGIYTWIQFTTEFVTQIIGVFIMLWDGVTSLTSAFFTWLTNKISETWTSVSNKTSEIWNGVKDFFTQHWNFIKNQILTPAIEFISTKISEAWTSISTKTSEIWNGIKDFFSKHWTELKENIINPALDSIKTTVSDAWTSTSNKTKETWNGTKNDLSSTWSQIKTTASSLWNQIKEAVAVPMQNAKNLLSSVWGGIKSFLQGVWNGILSFFRNIGSSITDSIVKPFQDALRYIEGIAQKIKDAANNINPYHRESPSLVDNVTAGIADIKREYASLAGINVPNVAHISSPGYADPMDSVNYSSTGDYSGGDTINEKSDVKVYIENVNEASDIERTSREIGFRLSVM